MYLFQNNADRTRRTTLFVHIHIIAVYRETDSIYINIIEFNIYLNIYALEVVLVIYLW